MNDVSKPGGIPVLEDAPAILDAMLQDQAKAAEIDRTGPYWQPYQDRAVATIRKYGIGDFRSNPLIGKGFANVLVPLPLDAK